MGPACFPTVNDVFPWGDQSLEAVSACIYSIDMTFFLIIQFLSSTIRCKIVPLYSRDGQDYGFRGQSIKVEKPRYTFPGQIQGTTNILVGFLGGGTERTGFSCPFFASSFSSPLRNLVW